MKTILALNLLAIISLFSNSALSAQTAQADLVNSSLRLETSACDCDIGGLIWYMDFSSAYTEERRNANRELAPFTQPGPYSHWSYMLLEDPSMVTSVSFLELNLPSDDMNGNGTPDFFEAGIPVSTSSLGRYQIDWGPCPLTVVWSRVAGANMGSYQLTLNDSILGDIGPFRGSFELVQAHGTLHYTPGTDEIKGDVVFPPTSASPPLQGPVKFTRSAGDPLNKVTLQAGALTNEFDNLAFEACTLSRRGSVYSGAFGLPTATYGSWTLFITDPNDSDHDGIPDLSDEAPLPPPKVPVLALKVTAGGFQLAISGNIGRTCYVEAKGSLKQSSWGVVKTLTLTGDPHVVDLPTDISATAQFWRVRVE